MLFVMYSIQNRSCLQWTKGHTLNKGLRLLWMALLNFLFRVSALELYPFFKTANITSCSGPPFAGETLIAAVSKMPLLALSQTCSISTELVCISEQKIPRITVRPRMSRQEFTNFWWIHDQLQVRKYLPFLLIYSGHWHGNI